MKDDYIICSTKVNSDGKFKITLPIPTTKRIIDTSFFPEDMPISDSEARIGGGENSNPIALKIILKLVMFISQASILLPQLTLLVQQQSFYTLIDLLILNGQIIQEKKQKYTI
jgi:hypothetical protein